LLKTVHDIRQTTLGPTDLALRSVNRNIRACDILAPGASFLHTVTKHVCKHDDIEGYILLEKVQIIFDIKE